MSYLLFGGGAADCVLDSLALLLVDCGALLLVLQDGQIKRTLECQSVSLLPQSYRREPGADHIQPGLRLLELLLELQEEEGGEGGLRNQRMRCVLLRERSGVRYGGRSGDDQRNQNHQDFSCP